MSTKANKISTLNVYPLIEISRLQFKMTIDAEKDVNCISNETRIRSFDFAQYDIMAQDDNMDEIMSFTLNKSTVVNITTVLY